MALGLKEIMNNMIYWLILLLWLGPTVAFYFINRVWEKTPLFIALMPIINIFGVFCFFCDYCLPRLPNTKIFRAIGRLDAKFQNISVDKE